MVARLGGMGFGLESGPLRRGLRIIRFIAMKIIGIEIVQIGIMV